MPLRKVPLPNFRPEELQIVPLLVLDEAPFSGRLYSPQAHALFEARSRACDLRLQQSGDRRAQACKLLSIVPAQMGAENAELREENRGLRKREPWYWGAVAVSLIVAALAL